MNLFLPIKHLFSSSTSIPSTSSSSINISPTPISPINDIPFDVLQEIFLHCLPKNPLDVIQPNPKTAPILLCHVSSSWRTVALSISRLWAHLSVRLPILWDIQGNPTALNSEPIVRAVEFMKWWRRNHHSMAPFLRFDFYRSEDMDDFDMHEDDSDEFSPTGFPPVDSDSVAYLLEYISSAQYLEVGALYSYLMRNRPLLVATSSKLHTLVALGNELDNNHEYYQDYPNHATISSPPIPSTVRRLLVQEVKILDDCRFKNWSTLTHLLLNPVYLVRLSTWFSLIRELLHLQWGDFAISMSPNAVVTYQSEPPMFSLPSLSTLSISCHSIKGVEYPLTTLFKNLELPALRTLYLASSDTTWRDSNHATFEIRNVLKSAGGITQIALKTTGHGFCCFEDPRPNALQVLPGSSSSPQLLHLQFMLPSPTSMFVAKLVQEFLNGSVISNISLDLTRPTTNLKTILITVSSDNVWTNHRDWKKRLLRHIHECIGMEPDISFEINTSEDGRRFNNVESTLQRWRSNA